MGSGAAAFPTLWLAAYRAALPYLRRIRVRLDRLAIRLLVAGQLRARAVARDGDRGDIPGWVMVAVMSAGLVVAVFAVFKDAITDAIQNALSQVVSETGG
jgi:hypothetical protein